MLLVLVISILIPSVGLFFVLFCFFLFFFLMLFYTVRNNLHLLVKLVESGGGTCFHTFLNVGPKRNK